MDMVIAITQAQSLQLHLKIADDFVIDFCHKRRLGLNCIPIKTHALSSKGLSLYS